MRYYETLYIVNPNFEDKKVESIISEVGSELQKTKSKVVNHHIWGKKRLAYPIQKQKYGTFILLQYGGDENTTLVEFDTWMKLNTSVLRHLTTRLNDEPEVVEAPVFEKKPSEEAEVESEDAPTTEESEKEPESVVSEDSSEEEAEETAEAEVVSEDTVEEQSVEESEKEESEEEVE